LSLWQSISVIGAAIQTVKKIKRDKLDVEKHKVIFEEIEKRFINNNGPYEMNIGFIIDNSKIIC